LRRRNEASQAGYRAGGQIHLRRLILTAMWQNGADRSLRLGAKPEHNLLAFVKQRAHKRIAISFLPQKWASWDHGKLAQGTY